MYRNKYYAIMVFAILITNHLARGLEPKRAVMNSHVDWSMYLREPTEAYTSNLCAGTILFPKNLSNQQAPSDRSQKQGVPTYSLADIVRLGINSNMSSQARDSACEILYIFGAQRNTRGVARSKSVIPAYAKQRESNYKGKPQRGTRK